MLDVLNHSVSGGGVRTGGGLMHGGPRGRGGMVVERGRGGKVPERVSEFPRLGCRKVCCVCLSVSWGKGGSCESSGIPDE